MTQLRKTLAWIFIAIIVVGAVTYGAAEQHAAHESQTNYENALEACHRNNTKNEAYTLAVAAAAETSSSPVGREKFRRALYKIDATRYTRADGTTECFRAVRAP